MICTVWPKNVNSLRNTTAVVALNEHIAECNTCSEVAKRASLDALRRKGRPEFAQDDFGLFAYDRLLEIVEAQEKVRLERRRRGEPNLDEERHNLLEPLWVFLERRMALKREPTLKARQKTNGSVRPQPYMNGHVAK